MASPTTTRTHERTDAGARRRGIHTIGAMVVSLVTIQAAVLSSNGPDASARPSVRIRPQISLAGETVRAMVRVPPREDNRLLRVEVDSEYYFRSSDVQLDGEYAAITHFLSLPSLPAGRYQVSVVVYRSDGERARTQSLFEVRSAHDDTGGH